ncbi:hypothetical protein B0H17DRAFT_1337524 [Mycena rosella]|uniref:Uncharacterized protein n=1 Tax=Mycena rosella TaxID=1033263 RepID=A0AAD7G5U2_MYCRO|nr:hypothetical protein B0H17DRAFT_1337524 [Mycena rosella]
MNAQAWLREDQFPDYSSRMPLQYDQNLLGRSTLIFPGVRLPVGDRFGGNLELDAAMVFSSLIGGSGCMPIWSLHYILLGLFGGIFILKTTLKRTLYSINTLKARNLAQSADARCFEWRKYRMSLSSGTFCRPPTSPYCTGVMWTAFL